MGGRRRGRDGWLGEEKRREAARELLGKLDFILIRCKVIATLVVKFNISVYFHGPFMQMAWLVNISVHPI